MTDRMIAVYFLSFGAVVMIALGIGVHITRRRIRQNAVETEGTILDPDDLYLRSLPEYEYGDTYVRFLLENGTEVIEPYWFDNFNFEKNQKVKIIYNRRNPRHYNIVTRYDTSKWAYITFAVAIVLMACAVLRYFDIISAKKINEFITRF